MQPVKDVDSYLSACSSAHRIELEKIRKAVKKFVPAAEESISYGMPAFKYNGKPLLYYASFKDHMSLFPTSGPIAALSSKLKGFKVSKGTIQFTLDKPIPEVVLKELLKTRVLLIDSVK